MDAGVFAAHAKVEGTHWWFTARRRILLDIVTRIVARGEAVADVGCGTGGNAAALATAGYDVLGVDASADAIALARAKHPGLRLIVDHDPGVARDHLAGGGAVVLADVLEHVVDDRALLGGAIAALPSGGHAVVTVPADPALWSPHDVAFSHHRRYRESDLSQLWRGEPVEVRLLSHFNARLRPVIAFLRRLQRGRAAAPEGDLRIPAGPFNTLLHAVFAGESAALLRAIDSGGPAFRRGVSLIAVLRRR